MAIPAGPKARLVPQFFYMVIVQNKTRRKQSNRGTDHRNTGLASCVSGANKKTGPSKSSVASARITQGDAGDTSKKKKRGSNYNTWCNIYFCECLP